MLRFNRCNLCNYILDWIFVHTIHVVQLISIYICTAVVITRSLNAHRCVCYVYELKLISFGYTGYFPLFFCPYFSYFILFYISFFLSLFFCTLLPISSSLFLFIRIFQKKKNFIVVFVFTSFDVFALSVQTTCRFLLQSKATNQFTCLSHFICIFLPFCSGNDEQNVCFISLLKTVWNFEHAFRTHVHLFHWICQKHYDYRFDMLFFNTVYWKYFKIDHVSCVWYIYIYIYI